MNDLFYELDPDGDVVLLLRNQDVPFAVWDASFEVSELADSPSRPNTTEGAEASSNEANSMANEKGLNYRGYIPPIDGDDQDGLEESDRVRMQVSSRHLILASAYFRLMFKAQWKETQALHSNGRVSIPLDDWDSEAMLILMRIVHGQVRNVPRELSLEMLAKIAVLVDFYGCTEVVELFSEIWIDKLKVFFPEVYSRGVILWVFVAWVFRRPQEFEKATNICLRQSPARMPTLGLPVPKAILDTIARRRQDGIDRIVSSLHDLIKKLRDGNPCSFECSSGRLGALTKQMSARHLLFVDSKTPFLNFGLEQICKSVRDIKSPATCRGGRYDACSLRSDIGPIINSLEKNMVGLKLKDFE